MMMTIDLARARVQDVALAASRPEVRHLAAARRAGTHKRRRRKAA